jgi:hypothetical protein
MTRRSTRHPAEVLTEWTHDHTRDLELHGWRDFTGTLDLDTFLAGDRVAIWAAASHDDRRGLVLQGLRRQIAKGTRKSFDNGDVERLVETYSEKYLGGIRIVPEPPEALVCEELRNVAAAQRTAVVEALREATEASGQTREEALAAADLHKRELNAANNATKDYAAGVRPRINGRDYLVLSSKRDGTTYRISDGQCSCTAGLNGKPCRHIHLVNAVLAAYDRAELAGVWMGQRIAAARARLAA